MRVKTRTDLECTLTSHMGPIMLSFFLWGITELALDHLIIVQDHIQLCAHARMHTHSLTHTL